MPPRRLLDGAATAVAVALGVEIVLVVGAVAAGTTSHVNVSTPLATAVWGAMAAGAAAARVEHRRR